MRCSEIQWDRPPMPCDWQPFPYALAYTGKSGDYYKCETQAGFDARPYIWQGQKVKLTHGGNTKYFLVYNVTWAGGAAPTYVYLDGGDTYTLSAGAITGVFTSTAKAPKGFPLALDPGGPPGALVPVGGIIMWSGSIATIPTGWALCNGSNGTPDLRDKFVIGAKQDDSGTAKTNVTGSLTVSGGAATHTLTEAEMPSHTHKTGTHNAYKSGGNSPSRYIAGGYYSATVEASHSHSISNAGSGNAHNNLPPYYALAFIMRTA